MPLVAGVVAVVDDAGRACARRRCSRRRAVLAELEAEVSRRAGSPFRRAGVTSSVRGVSNGFPEIPLSTICSRLVIPVKSVQEMRNSRIGR